MIKGSLIPNKGQFFDFAVTARRYGRTIGWFVRDIWGRYRTTMLLILFCGTAGVGLQGSVFGLMILYANEVMADGTVAVLQFAFSARSPEALTVVAVASLLSLSLSAGLIFLGRSKAYRLGFDYQDVCTSRVLSSFGHRISIRDKRVGGIPVEGDVIRLAVSDARSINRAARIVVELPVALLTFIGATAVMVYVSFFLTVLIIPCSLVAGAIMYRFNVGVAGSVIRYERQTSVAMSEVKELLKILKQLPGSITDSTSLIKEVISSGAPGKRSALRVQQLLAPKKSQFCINLLIAACIAVIVQYFGLRAFSGAPTEWGALAAYLIALRYALMALRTIVTPLTRLSRFYPKLRRYHEFWHTSFTKPGPVREKITLRSEPGDDGEAGMSMTLESGTVVGLAAPTDVNRYTIYHLFESIGQCSDASLEEWMASITLMKPCSADGVEGLPNSSRVPSTTPVLPRGLSGDLHQELLAREALSAWLADELGGDLTSQLDVIDADTLSDDATFAVGILHALASELPVVVLDEAGLEQLPAQVKDDLLAVLAGRATVIDYSRSSSAIGTYSESGVLLVDESGHCQLYTVDEAKKSWSGPGSGRSRMADDDDEEDELEEL